MMRIAIMSDLHVGINARSKDLCPTPPKGRSVDAMRYKKAYDLIREDNLKENFYEFLKKYDIHADYLVLPGDLTHTGQPGEVKIASSFIEEVARRLGVENNKILFAPGNHDVDWSFFDEKDSDGIKWEQRYYAIGYKKYCFRKQVDIGSGDLFCSPYFTIWKYSNLLAVSYNSASHDSPTPKSKVHHGQIKQEHLDLLRKELEKYDLNDHTIRIFIVHHHLMNFSLPIPDEVDFSIMANGENLLKCLHEMNFDFVIHGHMHHPRFETHSTKTYSYIPVMCSGSFSAQIETEWAGIIQNQFHLVTIEGRTGENKLIKGNVKSWAKNYEGWNVSKQEIGGIHHKIPFGSYVMPNELNTTIEPFIISRINHTGYVTWEEVADKYPDLEYLPLDSAILAFKRMSEKYDLITMYETFKDLILYKKHGK